MILDSSTSAVITGGASGLGAATARLLASFGVKVGIFDVNPEMGEALAKEIGGTFCKVDVTSNEEVDAAFAKARAAKAAAAPAPEALVEEAEPTVAEVAAPKAAAKKPSPAGGSLPTTTAEKIAWCRQQDAKA